MSNDRRQYDQQLAIMDEKLEMLKEAVTLSVKAQQETQEILRARMTYTDNRFDLIEKKINPVWELFQKLDWPARWLARCMMIAAGGFVLWVVKIFCAWIEAKHRGP